MEENAKRKFRAYYGNDWCRIAFEGLGVGDFIRLRQKKLDVIHVPEFKRTHAPRQLFRFKTEEQPKPPIVKPKISLWQSLKALF
ncbi:MAG: hypothetical protein OEZ48_01115 [Candidatus Bathyarchaeota archaeon]|nr:hypothetical protein [Candidatus Bathyarchaeota archaeon]MDH5686458.1 hypothetical protein [Candidatus Bathyarchaeota archaeon]